MNKNLIIILFTFLVLCSLTFAVPPFQTTEESTSSLFIFYPHDLFYEFNSSFNFHFHVANSSGAILKASQYSCAIHVFNTQNEHLLELNSTADSNDLDVYFLINETVTGVYQTVPYNVWCNSTQGEYGFISGSFKITTDSEDKQLTGVGLLSIIVLIPIIFALFMLIGCATLGSEHDILKIFLFLLSVPMIWISLHWGVIGVIKYYGLTSLQDSIGTFTYWTGWLFFVLLTYFILYWIVKVFNFMAERKAQQLKY